MIEFESVGPVKIDCDGCHSHIYVTVNKPDGIVNGKKSKKLCMTEKFRPMAKRIKEMEVYDDDIWVTSFPKCGTTWTQEMAWLLNNNLDYEGAKVKNLVHRFPFLEESGVLSQIPDGSEEVIFNLKRPRHIKSHLSVETLPDKIWSSNAKIIYLARNPKDCILSFYHHYRNIVGYKGSLDDFIYCFMNAQIIYAPFFDHVLGFWKLRNNKNVLFLFYEDMKQDLMSEIKKVQEFLGKNYTEEQLQKLAEHLSVDNMRKNPSCNHEFMLKQVRKYNDTCNDPDYQFIRKGKAGAYKEEMTAEQIKLIDEWTQESLKDTDFRYKY